MQTFFLHLSFPSPFFDSSKNYFTLRTIPAFISTSGLEHRTLIAFSSFSVLVIVLKRIPLFNHIRLLDVAIQNIIHSLSQLISKPSMTGITTISVEATECPAAAASLRLNTQNNTRSLFVKLKFSPSTL